MKIKMGQISNLNFFKKSTILTFVILTINLCHNNIYAQDYDRRNIRAGNEAYKKQDFKAAEEKFTAALTKNQKDYISRYNLANSMMQQKKYEDAIKTYELALPNTKDTKKLAQAHYNIGNAYLEQQKYEDAIKAYKSSLKFNPNDVNAKYNLSYALLKKKQQDQKKKDQQKDQQKDQKQDQKQQDQKQDPQQNQEKKEEQKQQQQSPSDKVNKQQAKQLLQAMKEQDEKNRQKVNDQKLKNAKNKTRDKNW